MSIPQSLLVHLDDFKQSDTGVTILKAYHDAVAKAQWKDLYAVVGILLATIVGKWFYQYMMVLKQVRGLPTLHTPTEFFESGARTKLPAIPFILPADKFTLDDPWKKYNDMKSDLFACTQMTTPGYAVYVTSNPKTALTLSTKTNIFLKPTEMFRYVAINIFGLQIVSAQTGAEHKRHKGVVKACFGENVMQSAWEKMTTVFELMMKEEGVENGGIVDDVRLTMIKLTLVVFCKTGFGLDIPWTIPKAAPGEQMSFAESLTTVEDTMIPQLLVPIWILRNFPAASVRRLGQAQHDFKNHLYRMYREKRAELQRIEKEEAAHGEKAKTPGDIFGSLVFSQMDHEAEERMRTDGEKAKIVGLTEKEIIGNMWIFLVHETTAHTLGFTQAFLALNPEWQEKLYDEITAACGDSMPTYRDINQLPLCLAALMESIRLRDIVMTLPKLAVEDTVLPYTTWDDAGNITHRSHVVKRGSHIVIDSPAASRNPFAWENATEWNPARWLSKEGQPPFTGFSVGARQCIGKRFAEVEMVAYLSLLVKRFRILPVRLDGESEEEMRERMMKGEEGLSFTPEKWAMKLERR
ncbi:hypothetical protein IAT38_000776 [Cryptococcus sp. DSM 104549]